MGGLQVTFAAQNAYRSNLSGGDRDFYRADLRGRGGADYRTTTCSPGNIFLNGTSYAIPPGGATADNLVAGTLNECDNISATTDLRPRQEINSAIITFDQELSENVSIFLDGLIARRDGFRYSEPPAQRLAVPSSNAFFVSPAGVPLEPCPPSAGVPPGIECASVDYSFRESIGEMDIVSRTWQMTAGLDIAFSDSWNLTLFGTYGQNRDQSYMRGATNPANLAAALASNDPYDAFNPFGTAPNDRALLNRVLDFVIDTKGRTEIQNYGIKVDGELFSVPGGEVKVAVGAEYYDTELISGQLRGPAAGPMGGMDRLSRDVTSAFFELFVPLVGQSNALPGIRKLVVNIAGRADDYSDVGRTENPKIGFNWEPVENIAIHGSYGESFRAPMIWQLTSAGGNRLFVQNYYDPQANGGAGGIIRGVTSAGGHPNIKPETAETYSLGITWTPEFLPDAQFSLNYFDVDYKGQIEEYLSNLDILRQGDDFAPLILRGAAAQAHTAALIADGYEVLAGSVQEALDSPVFVEGRPLNLGRTTTNGLDFAASIPFHTLRYGDFRFALQGTWFNEFKVALTPGSQATDRVNHINYPIELRLRSTLGWQKGNLSVAAHVNYQSDYDNTLRQPTVSISSYTTVDVNASYTFDDRWGTFINGLRIATHISNLFDRDPPFVDIAPTNNGGGGFDPQAANPVGRLISVSLSKAF